MRVLSASICLAAVACLAVHASLEQVTQTYFGSALQRDEAEVAVSEFDYRGLFLEQVEVLQSLVYGTSEPEAAGDSKIDPVSLSTPNCTNAVDLLKEIIPTLPDQFIMLLSPVPGAAIINVAINITLDPFVTIAKEGLSSIPPSTANAVSVALTTLMTALQALSSIPIITPLVIPLVSALTQVQEVANMAIKCATIGVADVEEGVSKIAVDENHCNGIADIYRTVAAESLKNSPSVPETASSDLKRLVAGSAAVLDLMDKNSISQLERRPLYTESDDIKSFAQVNLGLVISISNALEACMYIASDSSAAAEEYAMEEKALAKAEDEDDEADDAEGEDENEDEDEVEEELHIVQVA
ncbi:hypothetical protein BGX26_008906 [Mortierella sp. AD094]|nr:hypothetical protein BGX26_008906 [Mortierella sp. AD094]